MSKLKSLSERRMLVEKVFEALRRINPNPRCELFYRTEYQLLVSVVLSAQTTDRKVNECMTPLYEQGFDPALMVQWGAVKFLEHIRPIGLAPTKSQNVFKLSQILLDKYNGRVPHTREALEALPGVGRKTANVILGEIFQHPTLAVDTHVFRVTQRLGLHDETTPEKAEQVLLQVVDPKFLPAGHHWFILLGRYTCKAPKPLCDQCVLTALCPSCVRPDTKARGVKVAVTGSPHKSAKPAKAGAAANR